jgi:hypothetical protein
MRRKAVPPQPSTKAPSRSRTAPHTGQHTPEHTTLPRIGNPKVILRRAPCKPLVGEATDALPPQPVAWAQRDPGLRAVVARGCVESQGGHPDMGETPLKAHHHCLRHTIHASTHPAGIPNHSQNKHQQNQQIFAVQESLSAHAYAPYEQYHHHQAPPERHPAAAAPHHTQASTPQNTPHCRASELRRSFHAARLLSLPRLPRTGDVTATKCPAHTRAPGLTWGRGCPGVCGVPRWPPKCVGQHQ